MSGSTTTKPRISPQELKNRLDTGNVVIIDVREPVEYAREHIENAVLITDSKICAEAMSSYNPNFVVLQCQSGNRSHKAARKLLESSGIQVCDLEGGIIAWKKAGYKTIFNPKAPISIMRQVQITAGLLILTGTLLGAFVNPWFLILSGFVGTGLTFAGASGWCGMAKLLSAMPWNKVNI